MLIIFIKQNINLFYMLKFNKKLYHLLFFLFVVREDRVFVITLLIVLF